MDWLRVDTLDIRDYLTGLFLDTEFKNADAEYIARGCIESGLSIEEIEDILINEVALVCLPHFATGVGPWSGWPEGWVRKELKKTGRTSYWKRLINKRNFKILVADDWKKVKRLVILKCVVMQS